MGVGGQVRHELVDLSGHPGVVVARRVDIHPGEQLVAPQGRNILVHWHTGGHGHNQPSAPTAN